MLRPLTFVSGLALLGLGATLVARALGDSSSDREDGAGGVAGPRNADAAVPYRHGARIEKAFTIERSADDLYAYWRRLENLPTIMSHLAEVRENDDGRSHWVARGPRGITSAWDAELIDDTPGERIAWRSVGPTTTPNAGSVRFVPAPGGRGTEVHVEMEWTPPGGPLGASFVRAFGGDPALIVERDLRRFKSMMEAGDIALNGTDVKR